MNIRRFLSGPLAGLAFASLLTAGAVQAQTLDFGSCVRIEDLSARLACYDRAAGRAPAAAPAATQAAPAPAPASAPRAAAATATVPVPPAPSPRMPADPVAGFGAQSVPGNRDDALTAAKVQKREEQAALPKEIQARVTAVQRRPRGEHVLTLDNGQVWEQTEYRAEPRYSAGDTVVIRRGLLGSFLLTQQKGSPATRVKRIS